MVTRALIERLGRLSPSPVVDMGAAPTTRVRVVISPEQAAAGKALWEREGEAERRKVLAKAGFAAGRWVSELAKSPWERLSQNAKAKVGVVLTPHLYSATEVAATKAEVAPEETEAPPVPEVIPPAEIPVESYVCKCPPEMEAEMLDYIPKAQKTYIPQVMAGTTDIDILTKAVAAAKNILLLGETGLGKTTALANVAFIRGLPYASVNLNGGTTIEDFVGAWAPKESGGFAWRDGILTKFVRYGGLLVAEEVNAANPEILFALHGLLDDNRKLMLTSKGDEPPIHAHEQFCFAATMNPAGTGRYVGTQELNAAFKDRFHIVLEFTGQNIPKIIKDKNLVRAYEKIHEQVASGQIEGVISTRGLQQFIENRVAFGVDVALAIFLQKFTPGPGREAVEKFLDSVGLSPVSP